MQSFRKYLIYSIGEILLVMIGILLALQVNNWNEHRKQRIQEKELLIGIKENIQGNIEIIKEDIKFNQGRMNSCDIILKTLETRAPYHDSLDAHFDRAASFNSIIFPKPAFETLKSIGLGQIRSKALREHIINLFENDYIWLEKYGEEKGENLTQNHSFSIYMKSFRMGFGYAIPNDYNKLFDNIELQNILFHFQHVRLQTTLVSEETIRNSEYLVQKIDEEIAR